MALINCKECGGTVSDGAFACPHCGFPLAGYKKTSAGRTEAVQSDLFKTFSSGTDVVLTKYLGYDSVTSLVLPDNVTVIGPEVFKNCKALTSITLPKSLKRIERSAFECCYKLQAVHFPEGLTSIWEKAFYFCSTLSEVTFPQSLTSIGEHAFASTALEKLVLPPDLKIIEGFTFFHCEQLCSVTFPEHLKVIKSSAFGGCSELKKVYVPEGTEDIEHLAFETRELKDIYVPSSVYAIGEYEARLSPYRKRPSDLIHLKRREPSYLIYGPVTIHCEPGSAAMEFARKAGAKTAPL